MEYELRVLSGLHRGACLPLNLDDKLSLGSAADCDVVLVDQGMRRMELQVWLATDGWYASRCDKAGQLSNAIRLSWGHPEVLGGVVVTVCASAQPWVFISAEQAEQQALAAQPHSMQDFPSDALIPAPSALTEQKVQKGYKLIHRVILGGTLVLGFATFSISRTIGSDQDLMSPNWATEGRTQRAVERPTPAAEIRPPAASLPAQPTEALRSNTASQDRRTTEALAPLVIQRLKDVYLAEKLELDLSDTEWTIRGALDEEEKRQLERVLASFYKEHQVTIPLRLQVNSAEEMLPFKIQQFSGGALASVVVDDGTRLYVGDAHMGYTVQRIDGRRIVFAGKRKVEVIW